MARLKIGDKIKVHGFVMLQGLENGKTYTVYHAEPSIYWLKCGKKRIGHKSESVDLWIESKNHNRIEII